MAANAQAGPIDWAKDVSGDFSTAANWRRDVVPGSSNEAFLDGAGGAAYTVTLDVGNANSGGITVGSIRSASNATLFLDNTGEGSGTYDEIFTVLHASGAIDDVGYDIEASGTIKGALSNDAGGIVDAADSTALKIDTSATVINDGFIEAAGGGGLIIQATTIDDNGGGQIRNLSKVTLDDADIEGGTLFGDNTRMVGSGNVLDGSTDAVTIDGGLTVLTGASLTGEGQIDNIGNVHDGRRFVVKGSATLEGPVDNTTIMETAGNGTLTVQGAVSGGGEVVLHGGTMTLASSVAARVGFLGSGELVLGEAENFSGSIQNFASNGDTSLDLADVGFADAGEATFSGDSYGGVLTVVGANQTVQFDLRGDYLGVTFTAASADGGDASVITASTTTANVARFVQAAAAFAPAPGPTPLSTGADAREPSPTLAVATPDLARR